jgi:hypothetical protein
MKILEDWRGRLRRNMGCPPAFILNERREEYRGHIGKALAAVEAALTEIELGGNAVATDAFDRAWAIVEPCLRQASRCAFGEAEAASDAEEPVSGVIAVAAPSSARDSLRKVMTFLRRANS